MTPFASAEPPRVRPSRVLRAREGSAAIEFAFLAPVLAAFLVGFIVVCASLYEATTVQWSVERSLRQAMIEPDIDQEDIEARLAEDLAVFGVDNLDVSYEVDSASPVPLAVLRVDYDLALDIPFAPVVRWRYSVEDVIPLPTP